MWWTVAIAMQAAAGPPDIRPRPRTAPSAPVLRCPEPSGDDVVVCARDPEELRLRPLPPGYERQDGLPPAQIDLGGVAISAESEAGQAIGGAPPRAMVRLKLPF